MNERANWPAFTVVRSRFFSPFLLRNLFVIHSSSSSASSPSPSTASQTARRTTRRTEKRGRRDAGHGLAEVRRVEGRTNRGAGIEVIIVADHFIEEVVVFVVFLIAIENDFLFASLSSPSPGTDGRPRPACSPAARSPPLCRRLCRRMSAGGRKVIWSGGGGTSF